MQVSIVIPVYNEEAAIADLHREVVEVCQSHNYSYEIIIIDDGSTDKTLEVIKSLSPVKLIAFRKNYGQTAGLDAGIKAAIFPYIATLDGDGQNDPCDIPRLLSYLELHNLDVVSGWRVKRVDPFFKKFVSRGANILRKILINDGIHDSGCGIKMYKKECFQGISLYGEMHRFIPALLITKGFQVGELNVNHRPRNAGKSKYSAARITKGFIDMLSVWYWKKYALRPLHLLGGLGLFLIVISFFFAIYTIRDYLRGQDMSETILPLITLFIFLIGIQTFILGLMTDIAVKTYYENSVDRPYSIKESLEIN